MLAAAVIAPPPVRLFVGGYGAGIYSLSLSADGRLGEPKCVAGVRDASFLALSPDGLRLAAALETSDRIALFSGTADGLVPSGEVPSGGRGPAYIGFDGSSRLLAANYGDGAVASLTIGPDGTLLPPDRVAPNTGSGPNAERQRGPHAHQAVRIGRWIYACDLGTDEVRIFDAETWRPLPSARVEPGAGPRHLAEAGGFVYVLNEMAVTVTRFRRDGRTGRLASLGSLSLLSGPVPKGASGAEIAVRGSFLYASVRGPDRIAVFRIGKGGELLRVGDFAAGVRTVRMFAISPDGRFLVAAGQDSGDLAALPVARRTGSLGEAVSRRAIPNLKPTGVAFANP